MHYHARTSSSGRVILSRSSLRYLFFFVFLASGIAFFFLAWSMRSGRIALPFPDYLSMYALGIILASASFIILMNRGSPSKIVLDGDGLILIHPGKTLRIGKEDVLGVKAVETLSLPPELDGKKRLSTKKIVIELANGTAIPVYEGPNERKIDRFVTRCAKALESGPSYPRPGAQGKLNGLFTVKTGARGVIRRDENAVTIRVPIKVDVPGFLMGLGMQAGFGIFIFGSLPGKIDRTIIAISTVIWGLIAISLIVAFLFALFGKQKMVIGPKEIESRRRFLGLPFPAHSLLRSEAALVTLDLEVGQLSVISKELKRIMTEDARRGPVGEKMGELLGGKAIKLDVSSFVWSERIALQMAITEILALAG